MTEVPPTLEARTPRLVLACHGLRRELERLDVPDGVELRYLDAELHRSPRRSSAALQACLDEADRRVAQIVLAWGLCGGAVVGLRSDGAWLVIPRVHDCVGLLLDGAPGSEKGTCYLTPGWLADHRDPLGIFEQDWVPRVGRAAAERTLRRQFARYTRVAMVDTGLDAALRERARRNAELLALPLVELPGSSVILRRALAGDWDPEGFVLVPPGEPVPRAPFLSDRARPG